MLIRFAVAFGLVVAFMPAAAAQTRLKINSASWAYQTQTADVTKAVRDKCEGRTSCQFGVRPEDLGPDPAPGRSKTFKVNYKCRKAMRRESYQDFQNVRLSC
jgi:hypothetical protein